MDPDRLERALAEADIPILLMVLVELGGDPRWLRDPYLPRRTGQIFAEESGGLSADTQREVRAALRDLLLASPAPRRRPLSDALLAEMMSVCVGEQVDPAYVPIMREEMGTAARSVPPPGRVPSGSPYALIVGCGLGGLCAAITFEGMGIPYLVVEKNDGLGGTWYENTYPACGVDTPNHLYSYSFEAKHPWGHYFSKQPELLAYFEKCAEAYGVVPRLRFGAEATSARWDDRTGTWHTEVRYRDGRRETVTSTVLVTAVGQLNRPKIPAIPGLDGFAGPAFHTARWPADIDLAGRRVALVGTGASAVQAAPDIAARAARLDVYQRSPQWLMPNPDYHRAVSADKQWLLDHVPGYRAWYRFALFWRYGDGLHPSLHIDPDWTDAGSVNETNAAHRRFLLRHLDSELAGRDDLRAKATPDYPPYAKRMVVDNGWYRTLRRDNVDLVTDAITAVTADAVVTATGERRPTDVIVFATGFHASRMLGPLRLSGRDGIDLAAYWNGDDARAYLGVCVPHFPNLFTLLGPNSSLAHGGSAIFQIECQVRYVAQLLSTMVDRGLRSVEVTERAYADYTARVDAAHQRLVFSHPGTSNWYKNSAGRIPTVSPWPLARYWSLTRRPELADFVLHGGAGQ